MPVFPMSRVVGVVVFACCVLCVPNVAFSQQGDVVRGTIPEVFLAPLSFWRRFRFDSALATTSVRVQENVDYPDLAGPLEHLRRELAELEHELARAGEPAPETEADPRVADELGDLLFTAVNLARRLNVDPELALRQTTAKFVARVERAGELAANAGEDWSALELAAQDRYYDQAKEALR